MSPIRIHLAHMPTMLLAIVEDLLAADPGFVVVGRSASGEDALVAARRDQADVLLAHQDGEAGSCVAAALADPPLSIVSIARDGKAGAAVSLTRRLVAFEGAGCAPLAAAIRHAHQGVDHA